MTDPQAKGGLETTSSAQEECRAEKERDSTEVREMVERDDSDTKAVTHTHTLTHAHSQHKHIPNAT